MYDEFYGLPLVVESEDGNVYTLRPFEATLENMAALWAEYGKYTTILSDLVRDDQIGFYNWILSPDTIVLTVDDVGIIYATDMVPGYEARAHYLFWDRIQAGRQQVVLHALRWVVEQFKLHRVRVEVPRFAYAVLRRLYRMQFRLEGVRREGRLHAGKWVDVFVFGVLADEVNDEALANGKLARTEAERTWFGLLEDDEELMRKVVHHGTGSASSGIRSD